jgi:hypothetical protein
MIRGRHRGLPVAIDRAIVLPNEYNKEENEKMDDLRTRRSQPVSELSGLHHDNMQEYHRSSFNDRDNVPHNQQNDAYLDIVPESSPALNPSNSNGRPGSS